MVTVDGRLTLTAGLPAIRPGGELQESLWASGAGPMAEASGSNAGSNRGEQSQ